MVPSRKERRKKKRWIRALLWTGCVVLILLAGSALALNYAIDKLLGSLGGMEASSYVDQILETPDPKEPSVLDGTASGSKGADGNGSAAGPGAENSGLSPAGEGKEGEGSNKLEEPGQTGGSSAGSGGSDNPPASGTGDSGKDGYNPNVSVEKAKEIEENITLREKATISGILLSKLNASDISLLADLAKGGLTTDDKRAAKEILLQKLTEDEYNTLVSIAQKYGISQGRKYDEAKREFDD